MSRPLGGYIGHRPVPAAAAGNSAAGGMWTLSEAQRFKQAGTWPRGPDAPLTIAGLQLWLDAADSGSLFNATSGGSEVAADGGVARWQDKSGNARHATRATINASLPVRKASVQGGRDVLRFTESGPSSSRMQIQSSTSLFNFLHNGSGTVFVVSSTSVANSDFIQVMIDNSAAGGGIGYILSYEDRSSSSRNDAMFGISFGAGGAVVQSVVTANNVVPPGSFKVITNTIDTQNASASQRVKFHFNGQLDSNVNPDTGTASNSDAFQNLTIGSVSNNEFAAFSGDIAEIIIYNTALSDTDRSAVESYLMSKWAIT
jgi:hypothetical protein